MLVFASASALLLARARSVAVAKRCRRAVVLSQAMLSRAGEEIRNGNLVAFPTETVYGLGASALNPQACRDVFHTKGRPLTDPLIVHVTSREWAKQLLDLTPKQEEVFDLLSLAFWPGPLTIVSKASLAYFQHRDTINVLSASTGQIGVRIPSHPVARQLIDFARVPIAAPSANRFGHVSPTSAQHVVDDLGEFPIFVVDSGDQVDCAVGIESTVVGLGEEGDSVTLFRRGGVSESALANALRGVAKIKLSPSLSSRDTSNNDATAQVAPGQLLTHYSPDNVECFLWQHGLVEATLPFPLGETVIVDFNGAMREHAARALAYKDLSPTGDVAQACHDVFHVLRWTETVLGARAVVLPDVSAGTPVALGLDGALDDRLFRAASGKRVGRITA
ncbi:Sua5/YciO/YrdC/YwlC family tRNA threonylcarbamoyl adenosine modification protein [Batrachochytrium salamandrivorans]|nr:Sua5/YciO/YrdC/YwlC family tRNA threonylcarbamoyl adenosine modification protein [Batrachochytrium salamandrivorans]